VLGRNEEETPMGSLSWDVGRGSPASWDAGAAAIYEATMEARRQERDE